MAAKQDSANESTDSEIKEKPRARTRSRLPGVALLALAVAVSSLFLQFWQRASDDTTEIKAALNNIQASRQSQLEADQAQDVAVRSLTDRIGQLENRQSPDIPPDHSKEISSLQQETARLARQSSAMQSRLVEQSALSQSNDRHLARAVVEYLLKLGNERLQLFGDRQAALATLQLAEQQLSAMDDPLMLPVRRQLQEDIRAVTTIEFADPVLILSRIQGLETSLPEWPLKQSVVAPEIQADTTETTLWGRFKQSMGSLVTIRKQNVPVLTLEEVDWLQERIRTQFQVARIASLNGNQELFNSALDTVLQWHADQYQSNDQINIDVRRSLQQLMTTTLNPDLPDITRALREMQYLGSPLEQSVPSIAPAEAAGVTADVDEAASGG